MKRLLIPFAILSSALLVFAAAKPPFPEVEGRTTQMDALDPQLKIRHQASTLNALIADTKPTFIVSPLDLVWLTHDADGKPNFILNQVYYLKTDRGHAICLLEADHEYIAEADIEYFRTLDNKPLVLARHPKWGVVYEAEWPSAVISGTGAMQSFRHLFFLCDGTHHWHFVGEGPEGNFHKSSASEYTTTGIEAKVRWTDDPDQPVTITCTQVKLNVIGDDSHEVRRVATLSGKLPASLKWSNSK